jgi:predicted metal-dependent hydrolase
MLPLLRFTRDLFDFAPSVEDSKPIGALAPENTAPGATHFIASDPPAAARLSEQSLQQAVSPASYRHPQANREVRLEGATVAYQFARAKRKTIGFAVGPEGLTVRAPRWTLMAEVESAVKSKGNWILKKLAESRDRQTVQESARIDWRDGAQFPFLGQTLTLVLSPRHDFAGRGAQCVHDEDAQGASKLMIGVASSATPEQIRDITQAWLMRQARDHFSQRLTHFAPLLGVQWKKLSLSNAGTRWGSARSDGSIRLNWRLMHFRPAVIDYVVAHELSHLRVMDHSPRFWDTVGTLVPEYTVLRSQLKDVPVPKW